MCGVATMDKCENGAAELGHAQKWLGPGKYIMGLLFGCFVPFWYKGMQIRFELHMTLHVKYTFDYIMCGNSSKCGAVIDRLALKQHTASLIHTLGQGSEAQLHLNANFISINIC